MKLKLTDTQSAALATAAARADGAILPLPGDLRGGVIARVCDALEAKGLAVEIDAHGETRLVISDAGRRALGLPIVSAPIENTEAASQARAPRTNTKQAQLIAMLKAPDGASVDEIVAALEWQPHTVRGAIAGALKKKLGLQVRSEASEGRGRVYRIAG